MKHRTGEENFVSSMRKALEAHYGENPVALGGVFCLVTGKAKIHVMVRARAINIVMITCYLLLLRGCGTCTFYYLKKYFKPFLTCAVY